MTQGSSLGTRSALMCPAGSMRGREAVADCKTRRVVFLLQSVILGLVSSSSSSSSSSVRGSWSAGSFSSFVSSHRPAYTTFLASKRRGVGLLAAGDIVAREERTDQSLVSAETAVASSAGPEGSRAAQAYHERKREALSEWSKERRGRDLCERCRRARKVRQQSSTWQSRASRKSPDGSLPPPFWFSPA